VLNRFGDEFESRVPPVTLPELPCLKTPVDDEEARRANAARFAELRTIRAGVECWQEIGRTGSFESWVKIGKALQVGRSHALRASASNRPTGQRYCRIFSAWLDEHGFNGIEKTVRSAALDLVEHLAEIESWRATLDDKRRRQLRHPLSNVAAWRKAKAKSADPLRAAALAWRRFVACVEALPAEQALPLGKPYGPNCRRCPMTYSDRRNTLSKRDAARLNNKWATPPSQQPTAADKAKITQQRRDLRLTLNEYIGRHGGSITSPPFADPIRLEVPPDSDLPQRLQEIGYDPLFLEQTTRIGSLAVEPTLWGQRRRTVPGAQGFRTVNIFLLALPK
jgi:hypothetical protein